MQFLSKYSVVLTVFILYLFYYYFTRDNFLEKLIELSLVTAIIILLFVYIDHRKENSN